MAEGLEHPGPDLVAQADEAEIDVRAGEGEERLVDVGAQRGCQGNELGRPGGGRVVVLRVGPGVGEVKVEVDAVTLAREARREGEDVGQVVLAGDRVDPEADGAVSVDCAVQANRSLADIDRWIDI